MVIRYRSAILVALCVAAVSPLLFAEDLWEQREADRAFLFIDTQARKVGDLLTLIVNEDTDVDQRDNRALSRSAGSNGKLDVTASTAADLGTSAASGGLDASGSRGKNFGGSATFSSERQFSDRVTLTVMDVLPNGNLVVSGRRLIDVDNDQRELIVSGVVRPSDVKPDNTVHSRYVSELRVNYSGRGTDTRYTRPGWGSRFMSRIWPF